MRFVMFYHSVVSDWNHGNAHFLRGVARELLRRGHEVRLFEPRDGWSRLNLLAEHGEAPLARFREAFPELEPEFYDAASLDLDRALDGADVAIVHEWNDRGLVARVGEHRERTRAYRLLFHDTHHRAVTEPDAMAAYDLSGYDGVLAFGETLAGVYRRNGWATRVWTWHEAADTSTFRPLPGVEPDGDLVWVGNWGDDERTAELREFLVEPARDLGLAATVHGVRYPAAALAELDAAGIAFKGWVPNYEVPSVFARHRVTVHVPRRPYVERLAGIPTIRPFEALACAVPLVSAPWNDAEGLFAAGRDYLVARDGAEMRRHLRDLLGDRAYAREVARRGHETVLARHTCAHRVAELERIVESLGERPPERTTPR